MGVKPKEVVKTHAKKGAAAVSACCSSTPEHMAGIVKAINVRVIRCDKKTR